MDEAEIVAVFPALMLQAQQSALFLARAECEAAPGTGGATDRENGEAIVAAISVAAEWRLLALVFEDFRYADETTAPTIQSLAEAVETHEAEMYGAGNCRIPAPIPYLSIM